MTIPDKPLVLEEFDFNALTLGEMALFDVDAAGVGTFNKLRLFLIQHSNWTKEEVDAIQVGEMKQIGEQLTEAIQEAVVPLASSTSSKTGRASTTKRRRRSG